MQLLSLEKKQTNLQRIFPKNKKTLGAIEFPWVFFVGTLLFPSFHHNHKLGRKFHPPIFTTWLVVKFQPVWKNQQTSNWIPWNPNKKGVNICHVDSFQPDEPPNDPGVQRPWFLRGLTFKNRGSKIRVLGRYHVYMYIYIYIYVCIPIFTWICKLFDAWKKWPKRIRTQMVVFHGDFHPMGIPIRKRSPWNKAQI